MKKALEIFVFIDALGWKIAQKHRFLETELSFRHRVFMQFGYSCSAVPTILSGKKPVEHGHLSLFFRAAAGRSPFRWFRWFHFGRKRGSIWNRGRVRNLMSKTLRRMFGFTGYFQLYSVPFDKLPYLDYCEKKDIFVPGGLETVENLADRLETIGVPYHISDWRRSESENFAAAEKAAGDGRTEFLFVYTAGLDALLHDHVGEDDAVARKLRFYEEKLASLLAVARGNAETVRLTVISDHGMTPLRGELDAMKLAAASDLREKTDYLACYDSTMARFYFENDAVCERMKTAFAGAPGRWLTGAEKKRYGIDFADGKYGDEIFLLSPGWQIVPSDMGNAPLRGMHGFDPDDEDSDAVLLSNAPEESANGCKVVEVADFFRLMCGRAAALKGQHVEA